MEKHTEVPQSDQVAYQLQVCIEVYSMLNIMRNPTVIHRRVKAFYKKFQESFFIL
jgi:hypothetical protein